MFIARICARMSIGVITFTGGTLVMTPRTIEYSNILCLNNDELMFISVLDLFKYDGIRYLR